MSGRDVTWVEACAMVLEASAEPWMSAAQIFTEMKATCVKDLTNVSYGHGVRSIRSNLNCHSKKARPSFYRSEEGGIKYALKRRLDSTKEQLHSTVRPVLKERLVSKESLNLKECLDPKEPRRSHSPSPVCNGCSYEEPQFPVTVEIDPGLLPQRQPDVLTPGLLLPSPLHSLLAPSRTLSTLSSETARPIRKVRRRRRDKLNVQAGGPAPPDGCLPDVLQLEPRHRVPSLSSDIVCLKPADSEWGDGCRVQGWHREVESFEIDPDYISDSDSSSSSSSLLSDEPDSAPSSQQQQQQQLQQLSPTSSSNEDETTLPGIEAPPTKQRPRHSDSRAVRLGASPLFAPTSQLVSENIKVLLSRKAFDGLRLSQKRALIELLPSVDQADTLNPREDALSNIFFTSAAREWQDRMAIGAFTPEYRTRERAELKKKAVSNQPWKQKHYEEYWGDSRVHEEGEEDEEEEEGCSYPVSSGLALNQEECLTAITTAYNRQPPPPPAPPPPVVNSEEKTAKVSKRPPPSVSTVVRNHYLKARASAAKAAQRTHTKTVAKKRQTVKAPTQRATSCRLTSLPPRTPYRVLLMSLLQTPKRSATSLSRPWSLNQAPPTNQHPVFRDHFSLLSCEHVPVEFCAPVKSLPVQLPLALYHSLVQARAAASDHCYSSSSFSSSSSPPSLTVSLPRSLLHRTCVCARQPLLFCSQCHAMFHRACTNHTLCSTCTLTRIS